MLRGRATSTLVLAQPAVEDDAAFARRVTDRIGRLEQEGATVEQAAFVGGDRADAEAKVQRSAILRRLASLLTLQGRATQLYVDAAARGGRASQRLMRALAWAISDLAHGTKLKVLIGGSRQEPVTANKALPATLRGGASSDKTAPALRGGASDDATAPALRGGASNGKRSAVLRSE
jgi:hypothetical protein